MIRRWGEALLNLLFPEVCEVCGRSLIFGEKVMCTSCLGELPVCQESGHRLSPIEQKCFVEGCLVRGTSLFYYHKDSPYADLIRRLKYYRQPQIGIYLGELLARDRISSSDFFSTADCIIPVPIHFLKKLKRGYNQSREIAKGIRKATGLPIVSNLYAVRGHGSQTRRNAQERWDNTRGLFKVRNPEMLAGKHIILVDDVVTTGATLTRCATVLRDSVPGIRISLISLATTKN